jgi:hypothetical protein
MSTKPYMHVNKWKILQVQNEMERKKWIKQVKAKNMKLMLYEEEILWQMHWILDSIVVK